MGGTPKSLADIVESLAGAVFVDSNFKVDHVFQVAYPHLTELPLRHSSADLAAIPNVLDSRDECHWRKHLSLLQEKAHSAVLTTQHQQNCCQTQVMRGVITPLPDPNNVPIEPTRLLRETASKANSNVKFDVVPQEDRSFTVHVYIDTYLLARYTSATQPCSFRMSCLTLFDWMHLVAGKFCPRIAVARLGNCNNPSSKVVPLQCI